MPALPFTPRRTALGRRRGRPPGSTNAARAARLAAVSSEPPPKRRKYIPGGPGGGGRFVDEDGVVTQVVGRGAGRASTGGGGGAVGTHRTPSGSGATRRARASAGGAASSPILPRRERSTRTRTAVSRYEPDDDDERFSSAAAVAAAVVQGEGYKPREERGWEEFHPNLDIETTFMVFRAEDVDGTAEKPATAMTPVAAGGFPTSRASPFVNGTLDGGAVSAVSVGAGFDAETAATDGVGSGAAAPTTSNGNLGTAAPAGGPSTPTDCLGAVPDQSVAANGVAAATTATTTSSNTAVTPAETPTQLATPLRRRLGRSSRDFLGNYYGTSSTPKTPKVLPIHNQTPKEKLDLKLPSYRKTNRILMFEGNTFGRYVEKSMMNVGYQESDIYIRPKRLLIKASDTNAEEEFEAQLREAAASDPSLAHLFAGGGPGGSAGSLSSLAGLGGSGSAIIPGSGAGSNGGVGRVEYDMDEQDDMWLAKYNAQRKANGVEPITREIFEITITKIEKEWHALEKRIPKPNPKPPQTHRPRSSSAAAVNGETQAGEEQDSKCAICDDGDCENTNAIVFCDGCDLAVHQDCYGVPFIPEGQWLCRKCQLIGRGIPTCIFCPNTDGAFKQTNSSKWAHMLCAMWIPETSLGNTTFMEPIMDVEKVPKTRWRLTCYICRQKMGACIQCGNKACYQAFHVTCARRARLYLKMKNSQGALAILDNSMVLKAFCDQHCPPDYAKEHAVHQATRDAKRFYKRTMRGRIWADSRASALQMAATHTHAMLEHPLDESQLTGVRINAAMGAAAAAAAAASAAVSGTAAGEAGDVVGAMTPSGDKKKGAGQTAKPMWKLPSGAPVIPQAVFDIVETALQRFMLRRRREFVSEACRYWTLKREARRGAALLKRLQLQMETFTSMELTRRNFAAMGPSGRARLERRVEFAEMLIRDLEQLRSLANDVVAREHDKLEGAEMEQDFVDTCYFPIHKLLAPVVDKASIYDKNVFRDGLAMLQEKLDKRLYTNALNFVRDLCGLIHKGINQEPEPEPPTAQPDGSGSNGNLDGANGDDAVADAAATAAAAAAASTAAAKTNGQTAYAEARDRKRLGKRILKAIQPMLEAAVRAECDITDVPAETLLKELDELLEAAVELQQTSITVSHVATTRSLSVAAAEASSQPVAEDIVMTDSLVPTTEGTKQTVVVVRDRAARKHASGVFTANGQRADEAAQEEDADGFDSMDGDNDATPKASAKHTAAHIDVVNGTATTPVGELHQVGDPAHGLFLANGKGNGVLVDGNGVGSASQPANGGPLTPPQSHNGSVPGGGGGGGSGSVGNAAGAAATNGDGRKPAASLLSEGGVLWYLNGFSLEGTTAAEELWPGQDAVRSLSEDLTDMDDEELRGLEFDVEDNTITASTADAPVAKGSGGRRTVATPTAATTTTTTATDAAKATAPAAAASVTTPRRRSAATPFRKGIRSSARRR
ncbi:phd finger domain protein [Niveomyces insectorum RCEF 264]|uniref:Phd finger domain protein n=1 Tax=Niveomyces insectorum RCEF 264 TaxID=1081102 RepID=A0A167RGA0_9HYPO|nr:phd finger domain protein [Niveomyces insectorum RCEF 264]